MRKALACLLTLLAVAPALADSGLRNELALAERWLAAQRAYDRVPGLSVAVVHDQELLWAGASGFADLDQRRPASADTIYGICSISKLFTGIAVMQLRDQGKLALEQPVEELLPWYNLSQSYQDSPAVTLRSLLSHSSGLPREADSPYWMGPDFDFPTREQVRSLLGGQSTLYPAERYFQYSNLGLTLAGEIVSEVSGEDYNRYVRTHILKPLGLDDTDTGFPTDDREPRIAEGYGAAGRDGVQPPMPRYDARGITPAAGFTSTVLDLAKFASWQFRLLSGTSNELLDANTLREMQRVQWMDPDWSVARGLAFGVYRIGDRTVTGHGGDCPGFNTRLFLDPVSHYAVITMANRNMTDVDGYASTVFDILDAGGTAEEDASGAPATGPALDDYVGSYDARPWHGEDMVFRWKDGLALVSMPTKSPIEDLVQLKHAEGDRFQAVRSDGQAGHDVVFGRDDAGQVTSVSYHRVEWPRLR